MLPITNEKRLLIVLGAILVAGFLGVNITSYQVSSHSVRETLVNSELPLTSNNIYSEIQASLLRPIHISSLMAHDTFLKDWMIEGEKDVSKVTKYLREIKEKYGVFSTFVVSDLTMRYYHFSGILKTMSTGSEKDRWFFTMKNHPNDYRVDVDTNEASSDRLTIFVNHKIYNYEGSFIGVTGLGLDVATVSSLIARYKREYNRDIYFVDREGTVKGHDDDRFVDRLNIRDKPGIDAVADTILANNKGSITYEGAKSNIFLRYRYIPELDWYLMVEQREKDALAPLRHSLLFNLAAGGAITLLVLAISGFTVHRFQAELSQMARTEKLSGLYNRQFFEALFQGAAATARRQGLSMSLILLDIDLFKAINDRHGHLVGDDVIRQVAHVIRTSRRESDVYCRWGGDEFVILLTSCTESDARRIAEQLRRDIRDGVTVPVTGAPVTISMGLTAFRPEDKLDDIIDRADARLYAAKKAGRDRVEGEAAVSGVV